MDRLDAALQAVLVIGVLALEMLRAKQQAFAPENFAGHVVSLACLVASEREGVVDLP